MSELDELVSLKLRQARRREFPVTAGKGLIVAALAVFAFFCLLSLLNGCGSPSAPPQQTAADKKHNVDVIWGGHAEARRKRLP